MAYISASSLNSQAKCELSFTLSRTEEGKKVRAEQGIKFAMPAGTILHRAAEEYDKDRWVDKIEVPKTGAEIRRRYREAWEWFFSDPKNLKKEKITPEQAELGLKAVEVCDRWLWEEDVKKAAQLSHVIGTLQNQMKFIFTSRKPLSWYYKEFYSYFSDYVLKNPLDAYGTPVEFQPEKAYNIQYGDDIITGFADGRLVFEINGRRCIFIREMKSSATEYTPEDCGIDNQMGLYTFYEHVDTGTPYEDIYVVMHQLSTGVCTITQRTEENIDFLMRHVEERLRRQNEINGGQAMPMPRCGTNSYDHSNLMCDYKDICPVWNQVKLQPAPIVLGEKKTKGTKK